MQKKKKERNVFNYFKKPIRHTQRKYSADARKKMIFFLCECQCASCLLCLKQCPLTHWHGMRSTCVLTFSKTRAWQNIRWRRVGMWEVGRTMARIGVYMCEPGHRGETICGGESDAIKWLRAVRRLATPAQFTPITPSLFYSWRESRGCRTVNPVTYTALGGSTPHFINGTIFLHRPIGLM